MEGKCGSWAGDGRRRKVEGEERRKGTDGGAGRQDKARSQDNTFSVLHCEMFWGLFVLFFLAVGKSVMKTGQTGLFWLFRTAIYPLNTQISTDILTRFPDRAMPEPEPVIRFHVIRI